MNLKEKNITSYILLFLLIFNCFNSNSFSQDKVDFDSIAKIEFETIEQYQVYFDSILIRIDKKDLKTYATVKFIYLINLFKNQAPETAYKETFKEIKSSLFEHLDVIDQIDFLLIEGILLNRESQYDDALKIAHEIELLENKNALKNNISNYLSGLSHGGLHEDEKAIEKLKKSIETIDLKNHYLFTDTSFKLKIYNDLCIEYYYTNKDSCAIYLEKGLALSKNNLAKNISFQIYDLRFNLKSHGFDTLKNKLESIYSKIELIENKKVKRQTKHNYYSFGFSLFFDNKNYDKALKFADSSYKYVDTNNVKMMYYSSALRVKALLGDNAYLADRMYNFYRKDKSESILKASVNIEEKYKTLKKEQQLVILQNAFQNAELSQYKTSIILVIILAIFILGIVFSLLLYRSYKNKKNNEIENLRKQALQLQMNPHFFFNALNSINHYIATNDKQSARLYLSKFARLMRLTLENSQDNLVPLNKEIEYIENYLELEKLRIQNFNFQIELDENLDNLQIPPMLIQPILENSIKHAFPSSLNKEGLITIKIAKKENKLSITITDNGIGYQEKEISTSEKHKSLGMKILKSRILSLSKSISSFKVNSNQDGTTANIILPLFY